MNLKKYLSDRGYGAAFFLFCGLLLVMAVVSIGLGTALYFARPCNKNRTKLCFFHRADMDRSGGKRDLYDSSAPRAFRDDDWRSARAVGGGVPECLQKSAGGT